MDLKRLAHLVALDDERHFGRAAERVQLSQPAFSRSIQTAESELRMRLFDRSGTEVSCTAAGRFFIERARQVLFEDRCLKRDVDLYRERLIGDIAFGVGPFMGATLLPPLMLDLRSRFPGINTKIDIDNWRALLPRLRAEKLDFFIADVQDMPRDADLVMTPIARQPCTFFVRAEHPLRGQPQVAPAELLRFGLACPVMPRSIKAALHELFGLGSGQEVPLALECDDLHLLRRVAIISDTVLGSVSAAVAEDVAARRLYPLDVAGWTPLHTVVSVVGLKGRTHSPMAEYVIEFVMRGGRALAPDDTP